MNSSEFEDRIKNICKRALEGSIELRTFHNEWPEEANLNTFYKQVYVDIEDAIEHTPGFLIRKGIDYKAWEASELYLIIFLDSILLESNEEPERLLSCRESILRNKKLSKHVIEDEVKRYLGR